MMLEESEAARLMAVAMIERMEFSLKFAGLVMVSIPLGLILLYLVVRLASAAYYRSKAQYTPRKEG